MGVCVLGSVEARLGDVPDAPLLDLGGPKQRTLLAALALHRGRPVSSPRARRGSRRGVPVLGQARKGLLGARSRTVVGSAAPSGSFTSTWALEPDIAGKWSRS